MARYMHKAQSVNYLTLSPSNLTKGGIVSPNNLRQNSLLRSTSIECLRLARGQYHPLTLR